MPTEAASVEPEMGGNHHLSPVSNQLGDIPALTGLRFFAAFFVFMGHGSGMVSFSPVPATTLYVLGQLTAFGMSLFFVLSGFVIHYNYIDLVHPLSRRNLARFLVARFARLYPLFLLVLVADYAISWNPRDSQVMPYYLGFAQSWVYILYDHMSLLGHLTVSQVTWSISTEWFFYLCYPAIAALVARFGSRGLVVVTVGYMTLLSIGYLFPGLIDGPASRLWGPTAIDGSNGNNLFYVWVLNFSPFGRLHEFLTGVLAAHLFLHRVDVSMTAREARAGVLMLTVAAVALLLIYASLRVGWLADLRRYFAAATTFVIPVSVGCIVFCCARYRSFISKLVSSWPFIMGGEASYSIYLFHAAALRQVGVATPLPLAEPFIIYALVRFATVAILTILISIGTHRVFEVPCRHAIRKAIQDVDGIKATIVIAVMSGVPICLTAFGWAVSLGLIER
jgi:peptidoglycan/LPS O-acetylase OafA/YrhL